MTPLFANSKVSSWDDINTLLDRIALQNPLLPETDAADKAESRARIAQGITFITFNYGIDGVTIEIAKYARCLDELLSTKNGFLPIHFIGGNFFNEADAYITPCWARSLLPDFDGWDKWDNGKWFSKLFYEPMPSGSEISGIMAKEIWRQATSFARRLENHIRCNKIGLLIPVNVNSNPGNIAAALAIVLASESTGVRVLNSNHDFFWEGGTPASQKKPGASPGVRDHFFTNHENRSFFTLFKRILPWRGARWFQLNINARQSEKLIRHYGFHRNQVFNINTSIADAFFSPCSQKEKLFHRLRMAYILSGGHRIITPTPVDAHMEHIETWMHNQTPVVCGATGELELNIASSSALYLLQPTRIVTKKRIFRDWELVKQLLKYNAFREAFERDANLTLTLHITGPVPVEHQSDLENILKAYKKVLNCVPGHIGKRLFTAFSVGTEIHGSFKAHGFNELTIDEIYKMADIVLLPSETEGRGLPILEGSAAGIPVVCSRYKPERTFSEVVGEHLSENMKVQYTLFPDKKFTRPQIAKISNLLLHPEHYSECRRHNRLAIAARYNFSSLKNKINDVLNYFY